MAVRERISFLVVFVCFSVNAKHIGTRTLNAKTSFLLSFHVMVESVVLESVRYRKNLVRVASFRYCWAAFSCTDSGGWNQSSVEKCRVGTGSFDFQFGFCTFIFCFFIQSGVLSDLLERLFVLSAFILRRKRIGSLQEVTKSRYYSS